LLIADDGFEPIICDLCFDIVMQSAPKHLLPPKHL